ncbi:guanylate kinase [Ponticaulis sp.]|uniref:guanylate kinase n=1 Tax=Ponticaulis sp. TaxID=2020902 RepID=UPI000B69107F|nr:guanylate kinase [Ponticaulis sp.]MAI91958.1 guanylate kinase [Ponticaulis sp.]OUX96429.1 MAG: guanylate kinase [Hyphomonadaceae bacterium TMED5]
MSNSTHSRRGLMLVISSPSGAGKTTLSRMLMDKYEDVRLSVSATTRDPRPGEEEGVHYQFVDHSTFETMIEKRAFLEWAKVFDHFYGTPRKAVEERLEDGKDVIFDVDWQGADAIHDQMPNDVVSVFVLPPSIDALQKRLEARPGSDPEKVERRMAGARNEIRHWRRYDYAIVNEDIEVAFKELEGILTTERQKRLRQLRLEPLVQALLDEG